MIRNLVLRAFSGMGVGGLITFLALTIVVHRSVEVSVAEVRIHLLGSMITGVYFSLSALIFEVERWSLLKQTVIHYLLSLIVLFPLFTLLTKWVPLQPFALAIGLAIFTAIYGLNWIGWYLYFKSLERKLNHSIKKN